MRKEAEMTINGKALLEERFASSLGLDKYTYLVRQAQKVNIAEDKDFQRVFNAFYRVRKNAAWRDQFYELFERAKKENLSFEDILTFLYIKTNNVEASFASKMAATIDPSSPIIDQYVLKNLNIIIAGAGKEARLESALEAFESLQTWYRDYLPTQAAKDNIAAFDTMLPSYAWISDVKKIDFLLWIKS